MPFRHLLVAMSILLMKYSMFQPLYGEHCGSFSWLLETREQSSRLHCIRGGAHKEGPVKDGGTRVLVCAKDPQSSEIYVGRDWTNSG